jgi:hypothetical protein
MASDMLAIGCRLPHGLHLDVGTGKARVRVTLNGMNKTRIIGGCGVTPVPKDHWDAWRKIYPDHPAVESGAIFVTKSQAEAEAEGEIRRNQKTGFEGVRASDVDRSLDDLRDD